MNLKIAKWINRNLGDDWGGNAAPPGVAKRLDIYWEDGNQKLFATTYNNDGFELWIGTPHKWWGFMSQREARKLAWFILWTWWILGTWCGIKRWIWYKALHEIVKSHSYEWSRK